MHRRAHAPRGPSLPVLLAVLALVAGGCVDDGSSSSSATAASGSTAPGSGGAKLVFETGPAAGFHDAPWPAEARLRNGHPDVRDVPNPENVRAMENMRDAVLDDVEGFSPTGVITFRFDGPVAHPAADPMRRTAPSSPILLLDIDPASPEYGEAKPCLAKVTRTADSFRPANLLQLLPVPGLGLREGTRYAAIVRRDLGGPGGRPLSRNPHLAEILDGRTPSIPDGAAWKACLDPLVRELPALGIAPDEIAAATVFRTGRPTDDLYRRVSHVASRPTRPVTEPLSLRDDYPGYRALEGEWEAPRYQRGIPPFVLGGGEIATDASGNPTPVGYEDVPFVVSIPEGTMPADGFPLYFYIHGTGGRSTQVLDRGVITSPGGTPPPGTGPAMEVAEKGWAACSMALPVTSVERLGILAVDGYIPYDFFAPRAMRDNFHQMILELAHFRQLVLDLEIDASLCPNTDASASPDGKIRFDPDHVVVSGQSLGSYLTGMLAATLGGFEGAVLSGAGGSWVEFPFGPTDPVDVHALMESLILPGRPESVDRFHPIILLFDLAVGPSDNTHFARYLHRQPRSGPPPHVLVVEGVDDPQVPTDLQRALIRALGIDMVGHDPGPTPDQRVAPAVLQGGGRLLPGPVQGNRRTSAGPRTAGVVRHLPDALTDGHFVVFQRAAARHQVKTFLETMLTPGAPVIPR